MSNSTEADVNSVIESAMSRLDTAAPGDSPRPDPALARKSLGRRDYDLALAHRLEQLRSAMGEDPPEATPAAAALAAVPHPITVAPGRTFGAGSLAATALFSALAGAGLMWLAVGANPPLPEAPTRSISIAPAAPAPVAEPQPSPPPAPVRSDEDQVRETLEAWRQAWSNRDSAAYLSHYSPDFAPPDGQKRSEWAAARRKNLASRTDISVQIHALQIERIAGDQMKLSFLQDYASGSYREKSQAKTLRMIRQDGGWLIAGEWQGSPPAAR